MSQLLSVLQLGRESVDAAELPGPAHIVQELAVVKAVVVGRVALCSGSSSSREMDAVNTSA